MNIRHIEYILTITRNDFNITKTANLLFISQPALSKIVTNFENEINAPIFTRTNGRLSGLTKVGRLFIHRADSLVANYQRLMQDIDNQVSNIDFHVSIGITTALLNIMCAKKLKELIIDYPLFQFEILEMPSLNLEKKFISKELDLLITLHQHSIPNTLYKSTTLTSQPYLVVMDKHNKLSSRQSIEWQDLEGQILALPPRGYITESLVNEQLKLNQVHPQKIINISSAEILTEFTHNTDVITILPAAFLRSAKNIKEATVQIPLQDELLWTVELLIHKDNFENQEYIYDFYQQLSQMQLF